MKKESTLFILLSVILKCDGFLDKLLDPLHVGGSILKEISGVVHGAAQQSQYGKGYGGSSSASYSYVGSTGGEGYGQNYGYRQPVQAPEITVIEITKPVQSNNYGRPPPVNGYGNAYQGGYGTYEQQGGGGHRGDTSPSGTHSVTFNINLGSLFGHGNSKHPPHHGHKPDLGYGYENRYPGNGESYGGQNPDQMFENNANNRNPNRAEEYDRPTYGGYQNQENYQNKPNQQEQTYDNHESDTNDYTPVSNDKHEGNIGYTTETSNNDYNSHENQNAGGYTDYATKSPIQDERHGIPNDSDQNQNEPTGSSLDEIIKAVFSSTTENSKTPYELEKDTKVTTTNRKTTIRPDNDQPLLIPLNPNEYTYEGDKIQASSPKRDAAESSGTVTNPVTSKAETQDEDFDLDVRFGKDSR